MRTHHYLGLSALVGRSLRYVAEYKGRWLALIGRASAALKRAARDAWFGWSTPVQWQRIGLIAGQRFALGRRPWKKRLPQRVETLVSLGRAPRKTRQARRGPEGNRPESQ